MSGGSLTVVPSTLVLHECRGLKKKSNEIGERSIRIERLPDDHPSECKFEVCIVHPDVVQHTEGSVGRPSSKQEPEIVYRGNDEADAKRRYSIYAKILGGAPPAEFDPPPGPTEPGKRYMTREAYDADHVPRADYEALLSRVLALEEAAHKKK